MELYSNLIRKSSSNHFFTAEPRSSQRQLGACFFLLCVLRVSAVNFCAIRGGFCYNNGSMLGTKLANRYQIVREIGRGGMGVVYLAHDPVLDRDVAVKVVLPEMVSVQSVERFKREARVVAKMDHHSIVSVHDSGEDQGSLFFVMPFVQGTNLRMLMRNETVTLGDLVEIGSQVASALEYAHVRGIIHRDIKPENIMVEREADNELRVRITDFGLAMAPAQDRLTKTATIVGTILYMAPEQITGEEQSSKSDIYSLGSVLYECLTGQPPFTGEVQALIYRISNELPLPPRALQPQLDSEIDDVLMRCLEKDPRKRPSGKELHDTLSKYRGSLMDSGRHVAMLPTTTVASFQYQRPVARPFVGREKEFGEIQRRLQAAMAGECQLVLVGGEAGIGKTRLLDELETLAKVRSLTVLHGRFAEIDRALPYQGYCDVIQEYFRARSSSATPADFQDLAGDLISLFPVLTEIRELSTSSDPQRPLPEGRTKKFEDRTYIFELLSRTFTRMAGGKLLILLLEELHMADVSVEALDYIVRRLGPTPTFIVGTYRTTEVDKRHPITKTISGYKGDKRFSHLQLGPLNPSGHREFLEKLIGGAGLDDRLAKKFYEATEGNPYFTNELVRSLIDSGGIVQDDTGVYRLSSETALSVEELPATIQQTVQERVERLPEEQREILSTASVLGKTFDFADLKMMVPEKRDLEDILEQLLISGFLEEDRQSRGLRFAFSSGVLRDVLYGTVPRLRRRMLHRRYAEELERRNEGRLERVYGPLFEHYSEADVPDKVLQFGFLLAQQSLETLSPDDTIRILKTVLDFLEYTGGSVREEHAKAKVLLGAAHRMKGNSEEALRNFGESAAIYKKLNQGSLELQAITSAAETSWFARKVDESRRWVENGIDRANVLQENEALTKLLSLGATISNLRGDYSKARDYLDQLEKLKPQREEKSEPVTEGGTLTVAITSPFQSQHPIETTLLEELQVFSNVYETIVITDDQGRVLPHLCEKWESLNDGALFLFVLRKDVTLQDGRKLTAELCKSAIENAIGSCKHALPPGLDAIRGAAEHQRGTAPDVPGIVVLSDNILQIHLQQRLPIYPALLTDSRTALVISSESEWVGTGPFRISSLEPEEVRLEKNKHYWKGKPPYLDAVHFQLTPSPASMQEGFRSGKFDIVPEVQAQDLESILRERQATFVEAPSTNIFFLLANQKSPVTSNPNFRKALTGIIQTQDLVRRTLGRLGHPADSFLPPGILGHDPGRRRYPISVEKARALIAASGIPTPIQLRISISPATHNRYRSLIELVFAKWSEIGVEASVNTPTMDAFLKSFTQNQDIDLMFIRWIGDYDDPDAFTYGLFHSEIGEFRDYYSSPELDALMTDARLETGVEKREKLYRQIENALIESNFVCPVFNDVNYRLLSQKIRRVTNKTAPNTVVIYSELTREEKTSTVQISRAERGLIRMPLPTSPKDLNPAIYSTVTESIAGAMIFEPLTRAAEGARIIPWLASSFQSEDGGRRFRFRLRDGVRFHDGRRVTSRDVRYSFERLLLNPLSNLRWYASAIQGAPKLVEGKSRELEGFRIISTQEFVLELDRPLAFLPAILSNGSFSILPEGQEDFLGGWRQGVVGTGPYRVVSYEPNRLLKMEANPLYWRSGVPKTEQLEYYFNVSPDEMMSGFKSGKFSLVSYLADPLVESLLHDQQFAPKHKEIPWIVTFFMNFNIRDGVLADEGLRKKIAALLDVDRLVRRTRRFAVPARSIIPPAMLGFEPEVIPHRTTPTKLDQEIEITVGLSTAASSAYRNLVEEILRTLHEAGIRTRTTDTAVEETISSGRKVPEDLMIMSWTADYADPDGVIFPLFHSKGSMWGNRSSTPLIDSLIEQARTETDPEVRQSLYRRIEEENRERVIFIPLLHDLFQCFARPEVDGLQLNYFDPLIAFDQLTIRR